MRSDVELRNCLLDLAVWRGNTARAVERASRPAIAQDELAELTRARAADIVGEIAGRILALHDEWGRDRFERELSNAYRLRNRLARGYDNVSPEILYDIARENVPALADKARLRLADLPHDRP